MLVSGICSKHRDKNALEPRLSTQVQAAWKQPHKLMHSGG